ELPDWWGYAIQDNNNSDSTLMKDYHPEIHQSEWRWIEKDEQFDRIIQNDDTVKTLYSKISDTLST
ncbi:MAG: hypothetical protein QF535_17690, partial [Anaerolineales bacterium]|nr:hypothetical protein [Anaerolineales bacterium]